MGTIFSFQKEYQEKTVFTFSLPQQQIDQPIILMLNYWEINYKNVNGDEQTCYELMESNTENEIICGELAILKYISRKNFMYPNKDIRDSALVDKWLQKYIEFKTFLLLFEKGELSSRFYVNYIKDMIEDFDNQKFRRFIEDFDGITVADICWYCIINWLKKNDTLLENIEISDSSLSYLDRIEKFLFEERDSQSDSSYESEEEELSGKKNE
mgnify:CR=1 FL=1|tara:strand:- start:175 stop:810 length:636 start_codon:yes stop_codon:yes gene_type:complete